MISHVCEKKHKTVICQEANKNGILTVLTLDFEPEFSDMRIEVEEPGMPSPPLHGFCSVP